MNWIIKPGAGHGHRSRGGGRGGLGKTLVASRPGRTLDHAHTLHTSTLDPWVSKRKTAHLIGTPGQFKGISKALVLSTFYS